MSIPNQNYHAKYTVMNGQLKPLLLTLVILFFAACPADAIEKVSKKARSTILAEINNRGETVVLVELSSPAETRSLQKNISDTVRRDRVAHLQGQLRSSLSSEDNQRVLHQYEFVSGVAMRVNVKTLERLQQNSFVKAVYNNGIRKPSLSQSSKLVFANQASSQFTGNNEWAVAVLDTGVDKNHSFLQTETTDKVISEACYSGINISHAHPNLTSLCPAGAYSSTAINSGLPCTGYSGCHHGTHVAGIAAGDGTSFDGVARLGKIIAIQIFTLYNGEISAFDVDILKGLERVYALRNTFKIAAVNLSFGGGNFGSTCDAEVPLVTNIVSALKEAGIATIAASGNDIYDSAISWPACITNAIAVGATYDSGVYLDRSTLYSNESPNLDLYAPGSYIYSSMPNESFATLEGTSMATPHVAGAWVVLKHADPDGTVDEFSNILKSVGPDVLSWNGKWIRKRLDLKAALQKLRPIITGPRLLLLKN